MPVSSLTVDRRPAPIGIDTPAPRFSWRPSADQVAYQLQIGPSLDSLVWDSGRVASSDSTYVPYAGPPLASRQRYAWRVAVWTSHAAEPEWSEPSSFEMGLLQRSDWSARWISHIVPDLASEPEERRSFRPSPLFRRRFTVSAKPDRARLYITALGVYQAYLNGAPIGEERLAPGWTDYNIRVQFQTYDVSHLLRQGENVIAVQLGDGWYTGTVGAWGRNRYGDIPALLCQLEIGSGGTSSTGASSAESASSSTGSSAAASASGASVFGADASRGGRTGSLVVVSDGSWRGSDSGTSLHDMQLGERTDFTRHPSGWTSVDFDDSTWSPVSLRADPGANLVASRDDGVRFVEDLPAKTIQQKAPERFIVDFGANAAGVIRLQTQATQGQKITLRHAERLDANGELYIENLRGAEQTDEFVFAESRPATLEPQFTFHGFQYAEVSGVNALKPEDLQSRVLSSASRDVGSFECSDALVNQLQSNIVTSLRANFISIPTDCPQRNERLGWTADLQIFAPTALFNADVTNMLEKWLDDMVDAQLPSGAYADVAPRPSGFVGSGNTAWSDAGVIVPWILYERSGDTAILARMYDSMLRYMRYLEQDQTNYLRFGGRYGDWVSLGARTDKVLIGTAYLYYVCDLFSRIASVLNSKSDAEHYSAFAASVKTAFQERFVRSNGTLSVETQTAYAMAIAYSLLPESALSTAGNRLAALVEEAGVHLATGFLGTPIVMPALSDTGHHELACQLLRQQTYPSWLFEVVNGATSIWERWNGWTPDNGFYSPRMNSFNHYAFGAVGDWMYRYLAGLQPAAPGYRRVELRPQPGAGISSARASHESLYGVHSIAWTLDDDTLSIDAEVPPNTTARLILPNGETHELGAGTHHLAPALV
jgi:alpha-L-rhamnosidase